MKRGRFRYFSRIEAIWAVHSLARPKCVVNRAELLQMADDRLVSGLLSMGGAWALMAAW